MSLREDFRAGRRIGRAEFVRSVRRYRRDRRRLLGLGVAVLFLGGSLLFTIPIVYVLGRSVRTASAVPYLDVISTVLPVGILLVATSRTLERLGAADAEAMLLTTVHPRSLVVGLVTAEFGRVAIWLGLPLAATVGAFALGLGAPLFVATASLVMFPLVVCTTIWGYALGIGLLRAFRMLPPVRRVVKVLGVLVLFVAVVLSQLAGQFVARNDVSIRVPVEVLTVPPLTEYFSLTFVGTPVSAPLGPGGLGVFAAWIVLTPIGLAVAERQASALWLTDGPSRSGRARSHEEQRRSPAHFAPPRPFSRSTAGRIGWGFLVRAARKPQKLVHLLVIVFYVAPVAGPLVWDASGETLATVVAGSGVVLGAYLSGAAFGLNPLGDDRPQLPLVLLTETAPRTTLRGRTIAGLAVGLPFATLVPLAVLGLGGAPLDGIAFAIAGIGWCVLGALFALGLGCAYPLYEERDLWGTETVAPSTLVLMAYTTIVLGGTSLGLVLTWYGLAGFPGGSNLLPTALAAYLVVAVAIPVASYRYALRRYRRYTLD